MLWENGFFLGRLRLSIRPLTPVALLFLRIGMAVHPFLATFRTVSVGKSGFGMDLNIIFDTLPLVLSVPNFFREKALELADMPAKSEDAFGDLNAGCQLVCIEGCLFAERVIFALPIGRRAGVSLVIGRSHYSDGWQLD
jgi:hypothetical protein